MTARTEVIQAAQHQRARVGGSDAWIANALRLLDRNCQRGDEARMEARGGLGANGGWNAWIWRAIARVGVEDLVLGALSERFKSRRATGAERAV